MNKPFKNTIAKIVKTGTRQEWHATLFLEKLAEFQCFIEPNYVGLYGNYHDLCMIWTGVGSLQIVSKNYGGNQIVISTVSAGPKNCTYLSNLDQAAAIASGEIYKLISSEYDVVKYIKFFARKFQLKQKDFEDLGFTHQESSENESLYSMKNVNVLHLNDHSTDSNYVLCVPPNITSLQEALNWSFSQTDDQYKPEIQT